MKDQASLRPGGGLAALPSLAQSLGAEPTWEPAPLEVPVSVEGVRALEEREIAAVPENWEAPGRGQLAPTVQMLRAKHHEIARLLTVGMSVVEIAEVVGTTPTTVNRLRRTPAFADLLYSYMAQRDAAAVDIGARLKGVAALALDKLAERLEEPAQLMPLDVLQKTAMGLLDRAGHSPVQKSVNLHAGVTAEQIREIKRARAATVAVVSASEVTVAQSTLARESGGGNGLPAQDGEVAPAEPDFAGLDSGSSGPVGPGAGRELELAGRSVLDLDIWDSDRVQAPAEPRRA